MLMPATAGGGNAFGNSRLYSELCPRFRQQQHLYIWKLLPARWPQQLHRHLTSVKAGLLGMVYANTLDFAGADWLAKLKSKIAARTRSIGSPARLCIAIPCVAWMVASVFDDKLTRADGSSMHGQDTGAIWQLVNGSIQYHPIWADDIGGDSPQAQHGPDRFASRQVPSAMYAPQSGIHSPISSIAFDAALLRASVDGLTLLNAAIRHARLL
mmetsp:Transcript_74097/g.176503  ORF Transcript_74097/g.176503 Transcript_74097/m.176503 type:complete len:212 (+) Transcript_74097:56-691(+)